MELPLFNMKLFKKKAKRFSIIWRKNSSSVLIYFGQWLSFFPFTKTVKDKSWLVFRINHFAFIWVGFPFCMDSNFMYILITKKQALVIFLGSFSLFLFIVELKVPLTLISRVFAFLLFIDTNIFFWLNHVSWCMFNVNLKKYNTYRCLLILVLNMVTGVLSFLLGDIKCK